MAWLVDPCPAEFTSLSPPYRDCPAGLTGAIALRSIVPCRRPTQTGTPGQWRRLGKPQASPNALLRHIAPFYAWVFHFVCCDVIRESVRLARAKV